MVMHEKRICYSFLLSTGGNECSKMSNKPVRTDFLLYLLKEILCWIQKFNTRPCH